LAAKRPDPIATSISTTMSGSNVVITWAESADINGEAFTAYTIEF
jgi:hypothetical protein